ncbi:MAG: VWA domain-containing protein [Bacteroidetes bacterium]|nr:VWA domain-containing protein [Bacteroidota bacterium]
MKQSSNKNSNITHQTLYNFLILLFSFSISIAHLEAQSNKKIPKKTRILFLLDASGSMLARWEKDLRINTAKKLLSDIVDSLEQRKNLQLALRVYGHQYPKRVKNCKDTKLEVPFSPNNHAQIKKKLKLIQPKGVTPIAYSLEQAANDFPKPPPNPPEGGNWPNPYPG